MTPRPSTSTLFPYTTLFRSQAGEQVVGSGQVLVEVDEVGDRDRGDDVTAGRAAHRSEEHTSELQSRGHLVCRLLLEKKKHVAVYNEIREKKIKGGKMHIEDN